MSKIYNEQSIVSTRDDDVWIGRVRMQHETLVQVTRQNSELSK